VNGPDGDKLQEEIKEISKPEEEVDDIPSHPPPQPPSQPPLTPKEPLPEEEDIPVKAVEIKDNVVEDDDSDHYYDKVPDQLDVKDDKNNDNEDDDLYEIPTSSKLPDKLPDGCRFAVSNVMLLLILVSNRIGGVMVSLLALSVVDRRCEPRSDQTKNYKIGICCFSAKHTALRRKSKH